MSTATRGAGALLATIFALGATTATAQADPPPANRTSAPGDSLTAYPECHEPPAPAKASKGAIDRAAAAHGAFLAGKASFDGGDYATALTYFQDAYRRDCRKNELLLIIARSYELLDKQAAERGRAGPSGTASGRGAREAAHALEVYLARAPSAADAPAQREHLTRLHEQMARLDSEAAAAASGRTRTQAGSSAAARDGASSSVRAGEPGPTPAPGPGVTNAGSSGSRALPWALTGTGVVAVATGAVLFGVGSAKVSTADESCPSRSGCAPAVTSSGNGGAHLKTAGAIVLAAGGLAAVSGLVWYLATPSPEHASAPSSLAALGVAPIAAPGLAGVAVDGSWSF